MQSRHSLLRLPEAISSCEERGLRFGQEAWVGLPTGAGAGADGGEKAPSCARVPSNRQQACSSRRCVRLCPAVRWSWRRWACTSWSGCFLTSARMVCTTRRGPSCLSRCKRLSTQPSASFLLVAPTASAISVMRLSPRKTLGRTRGQYFWLTKTLISTILGKG